VRGRGRGHGRGRGCGRERERERGRRRVNVAGWSAACVSARVCASLEATLKNHAVVKSEQNKASTRRCAKKSACFAMCRCVKAYFWCIVKNLLHVRCLPLNLLRLACRRNRGRCCDGCHCGRRHGRCRSRRERRCCCRHCCLCTNGPPHIIVER
jgi:hypothetical protein